MPVAPQKKVIITERNAYRNNQKDSFMFKHYVEHHGQGTERPEFGMKVLRYHRSATTRQVHKAVVIWQRSRGVKKGEGRMLNSKEYICSTGASCRG